MDLNAPANVKPTITYNDTIDRYVIGSKMGGSYITAPIMMSGDELYENGAKKKVMADFFRKKNDEIYQQRVKKSSISPTCTLILDPQRRSLVLEEW